MNQAQGFLSGNGDIKQCLVVVFLRGGADGLNMVAPLEDDAYHRARPRIALSKQEAVSLDGFFGLHPMMSDLHPAYKEGELLIVHGAGSEDSTRSHFEAQDLMEHGGLVAGGWLGRFLRFRPDPADSALSAVAVGKSLPECLRGAPAASVLESLDDFALGDGTKSLERELRKLYAAEAEPLGGAARDTLAALQRIEELRGTPYSPEQGANYPDSDFGARFVQVARLIKARVGLEAVSIDLGGWDSHFVQGTLMDPLMLDLSGSLAAFWKDLGPERENTTVIVMTEFGRRVGENSAFGTDHGRGSVMFVMGGSGGVSGGQVMGPWIGLTDENLVGPGDLPVTNNYRNVLAPILQRHGAGDDLSKIFPDFKLDPLPIYS